MEWDAETCRSALIYAYKIARDYATDPRTQNAAVLYDEAGCVITEGWNCFPAGFAETKERWGRPQKYNFVEHAERNAIYEAADLGVSTKGATMVAPWAACYDCARAIVQAGVVRLVRHTHCQWFGEKHGLKWNVLDGPDELLRESGVEIIDHPGAMHASLSIRHSGYIFKP